MVVNCGLLGYRERCAARSNTASGIRPDSYPTSSARAGGGRNAKSWRETKKHHFPSAGEPLGDFLPSIKPLNA